MSRLVYLRVEDLLQLMEDLGAGPVRDAGLLDSAAARPRSSVFGQDAYLTLELKAAALLHSVCKNHALVDGNKRLAWHGTTVFLDLNGFVLTMPQNAAFELVMQVADGTLDLEEIATVLGDSTAPR